MKNLISWVVVIVLGVYKTHADTLSLDSLEKWQVSGFILITDNAFAPIPAFSFDNPALMTMLSLKKGKFRYEPDFSIGLNAEPWMWNNWFRYNFLERKKTTLNLGINPSLFFADKLLSSGESVIGANRNLTWELRGEYLPSSKTKLTLTYRFNRAFDSGTLDGHSIDLTSEITGILNFKGFALSIRPQFFYFNSEDIYKGFFAASSFMVFYKNIPLLFSYQGVQSVWENYLKKPSYNDNISFIYLF